MQENQRQALENNYLIGFSELEFTAMQGTINVLKHNQNKAIRVQQFVMGGFRGIAAKILDLADGKTDEELFEEPLNLSCLIGNDTNFETDIRGDQRLISFRFNEMSDEQVKGIAMLTRSSINDVLRIAALHAIKETQNDVSWESSVADYIKTQQRTHDTSDEKKLKSKRLGRKYIP